MWQDKDMNLDNDGRQTLRWPWGSLPPIRFLFLQLMVVMAIHLCEQSKKHQIVHFKGVNYIVREFYLNKAVTLKKKNF